MHIGKKKPAKQETNRFGCCPILRLYESEAVQQGTENRFHENRNLNERPWTCQTVQQGKESGSCPAGKDVRYGKLSGARNCPIGGTIQLSEAGNHLTVRYEEPAVRYGETTFRSGNPTVRYGETNCPMQGTRLIGENKR